MAIPSSLASWHCTHTHTGQELTASAFPKTESLNTLIAPRGIGVEGSFYEVGFSMEENGLRIFWNLETKSNKALCQKSVPSAKLGNMWMPVFLERDVLEAGGNGPSEDVLRFFSF